MCPRQELTRVNTGEEYETIKLQQNKINNLKRSG